MKADNELAIEDLGFGSEEELFKIISSIDLSSAENIELFEGWKLMDGTKKGLIRRQLISPEFGGSLKSEKETLFVSFSGGRTSAYMCWYLIKHWSHKYNFVFIFANTGMEDERTLKFVDRCDKEFGLNLVWVEAVFNHERNKGTTHKIVTFETATRGDALFREMASIYGVPNAAYPHCNRDLKIQPIQHYKTTLGLKRNHLTAIGIRGDEIDRMRDDAEEAGIIYPLISWQIAYKPEIIYWWSKRSFDLEVPEHYGNCFSGDTEFLTRLGPIPLKYMPGLTEVLTRDGWKMAIVSSFGVQETLTLTVKSGKTLKIIEATPDHKWICCKYKNGNRKVEEVRATRSLQAGDRLFNCWADLSGVEITDSGVVHGFTFGDGSLEGSRCRTYVAPCKSDMDSYFEREGYVKKSANRYVGIPGEYKSFSSWRGWSESYKASFISGLIASDGSVTNAVNISNKSSDVVLELKRLAESLGLICRVRLDVVRDTNYKDGAYLSHLSISNPCVPDSMILRGFHRSSRSKIRTNPKTWEVVSIAASSPKEVFCATVIDGPSEFTLEGGLLTHNCVTCWKKSDRKLMTIAQDDESLFKPFFKIEIDYGHIKAPDKDRAFFRKHRTTFDILNMSKQDFERFEDYVPEVQLRLISDGCIDVSELDREEDCGGSECSYG